MYAYSYLKTATAIVEMYNGEVPLAIHLKSYFKLNKKFGSKDRKYIAHLCYCYYRTGNLFKKETVEEKITKSLFLCSTISNALLQGLHQVYNENVELSLDEKLALLQVVSANPIFPLLEEVSEAIDKPFFIQNQLQQPFLYVRIRPKNLAKVLLQLKTMDVAYTIIDPYTIQFPNGFKVEEHFLIDKEVVIQDYASQMVLQDFLQHLKPKQYYKVWDCCAASGGKSILLYDMYDGKIDLFVTDIRKTILENLDKRFFTARVMNYKAAEVNLYKKPLDTNDVFDAIICDAPCSGSGTWARTPEQIKNFKVKQLEDFQKTQVNIASNASKSLKEGGYFLYITCSVFAAENEKVVEQLVQKTDLKLIQSHFIKGYERNADTMFVALLQKA